MGELVGATGVTAVASQLRCVTGIVTVLAAILVVAGRDAVAGRMSTFLGFSHNQSDQPFLHRTALRRELFPMHTQETGRNNPGCDPIQQRGLLETFGPVRQ